MAELNQFESVVGVKRTSVEVEGVYDVDREVTGVINRPIRRDLSTDFTATATVEANLGVVKPLSTTFDATATMSANLASADYYPGSTVFAYDAEVSFGTTADGTQPANWTDRILGTDASANGDPTVNADALNGRTVVAFDGTDYFETQQSQSQPFTVMIVAIPGFSSPGQDVFLSGETGARGDIYYDSQSDGWAMNAGQELTSGNFNTTDRVITAVFDGADSELRVDGTTVAAGSAGGDSLGVFLIGGVSLDASGSSWIGDIAHYEGHLDRPSNGLETREQQLADAWGVTI